MRRMIAVRDRPRIGISACLLGERVRYNGGDKRDIWLVETLGPRVEWIPVCPEVEAGFGTPREPMELVRDPEHGIVLMTTSRRPDLTATLRAFAERRVEALAGLDLTATCSRPDRRAARSTSVESARACLPAP